MFSFRALHLARGIAGSAVKGRYRLASLPTHKIAAAYGTTSYMSSGYPYPGDTNTKRTYPRVPLESEDGDGDRRLRGQEETSDSVRRLPDDADADHGYGATPTTADSDRSQSLRDRYSSNRRRDDDRQGRGGDGDRGGDRGGDRDRGPALSRREQRRRDYDEKYSHGHDNSYGRDGNGRDRGGRGDRDRDRIGGSRDSRDGRDGGFRQRERRPYGDRQAQGQGQRRGQDRDSHRDSHRSPGFTSGYNSGSGPDREDWGYWEGDYLFGISPIKAALSAFPPRREFSELFIQEGMDVSTKKDSGGAAFILKHARSHGLSVRSVSKHALNMLSENRPNQGFVLRASEIQLLPLPGRAGTSEGDTGGHLVCPHAHAGSSSNSTSSSKPTNPNPVILALDEVWDPMNMGALLRTALYLGASGVVVCSKNCAPLSATVSKASSGALESMDVYGVPSMMKYLDDAKEAGWAVVGTSLAPGALDVQELSLTHLRSTASGSGSGQPIILVLGNEGHGLRTNVLNECTHHVKIPSMSMGMGMAVNLSASASGSAAAGAGEGEEEDNVPPATPHHVDSLNVSVAGGILMHNLLSLKD